MKNNNQIKSVLIADVDVTCVPDQSEYDFKEQYVFLDNEETATKLSQFENVDVVNSSILLDAQQEAYEYVDTHWDAEQTSMNLNTVAVDKLTPLQMRKLLRDNPQLSLQKVEGDTVSFKTKDTFYLEQTESLIDSNSNADALVQKTRNHSALNDFYRANELKEVVNS